MDFIKTGSLRVMSELTLQRNWIRIIWMSRKGVMIKLAKTGPDGLKRATASEPRVPADRGTIVPRSTRVQTLHPSGLSARPSTLTDPGSNSPRSNPSESHDLRPRTTAPREQGSIASRPRNTTHVPRTIAPSDQEGIIPRPTRTFDQSHPSDQTRRTNENSLGHDRPNRTNGQSQPDSRPNIPTDHPNGPVDPKPFLKPVSHDSSPTTWPTY
ncbi:unnamed protein product [Microthlaspi erraticum]|uniref:Uncharacterized protein n=1 Tax=Microthlaspi erraticum TaxID=1685480 RepID=A0A6D2I7L4_9BRAS|nr:unnamed protein product [Microthlaspi erraticum]